MICVKILTHFALMLSKVSAYSLNFKEAINSSIYHLIGRTTFSDMKSMESYLHGISLMRPSPYSPQSPTLFNTLLKVLSPDDFFMTLNYDLVLDKEILLKMNGIDYGLEKEYMKRREGSNPIRLLQDFDKGKFTVYHLHGSLNWEGMNDGFIWVSSGALPNENLRYKQYRTTPL